MRYIAFIMLLVAGCCPRDAYIRDIKAERDIAVTTVRGQNENINSLYRRMSAKEDMIRQLEEGCNCQDRPYDDETR